MRLKPIVSDHRLDLYRAHKGGIWVEVGVQEGINALEILRKADPEHLHLVDPWLEMPEECPWLVESQGVHDSYFAKVSDLFAPHMKRNQLTIHRMRSEDAAAEFKKKRIRPDCVYIDANHTYEFTKQDIELWLPILKQGGYLMCHDYVEDGLDFGVIKAVNELVDARADLEWQGITAEPYPTAVMRKTAA